MSQVFWLYFIIYLSCALSENNTIAMLLWLQYTQRPVLVSQMYSPLLMRPSLDKQPCGWTLVTKIGSSPLLLPRPPATVMPSDSWGSFFTVTCFSLQLTHWERSWKRKGNKSNDTNRLQNKSPTLGLAFFSPIAPLVSYIGRLDVIILKLCKIN